MLVTTDGSENSRLVLPHAAALASAVRAELTLLRVLDPLVDAADVITPRLDQAIERVRAAWLAGLQETVAATRLSATPLVVTRLHGEDIAGSILRVATDLNASMIAIHTQGHSAVKEVIFGSVALSVVRAAPIPVMVSGPTIEPARRPGEAYHIVVTSDCSPASEQIFVALRSIARTPGITFSIVHVCGPEMDCRRESSRSGGCGPWLELSARKLGVGQDTQLDILESRSDVSQAIIERAVALGADAIAMSTHGHSAITRFVAGGVALGVVKRSPLPVILQHARS